MMDSVKGSLDRCDIVLVVTDVFGTVPLSDEEPSIISRIKNTKQKVIVVVNKIDIIKEEEDKPASRRPIELPSDLDELLAVRTNDVPSAVAKWRAILPDALCIIPLSAATSKNVATLTSLLLADNDVPASFRDLGRPVAGMFRKGEKTVTDADARDLLPVAPPLYPFDEITDRSERFFASEIIREAIFGKLSKELPYSCDVNVVRFTENVKVRQLRAYIIVERDSQKGMVVGKGGKMVKDIGQSARIKLEEFFQSRIYLDLQVKVEKNWRKDKGKLEKFGYERGQ